MSSTLAVTVVIILLTLAFDFINGFHDTATAVATSISTRALSPKAAIALCAVFNFVGAFLGTEVAKTVGDGIVDQNKIPLWVIAAVILGAIIWNLITWYFGIPSSLFSCLNRIFNRWRNSLFTFSKHSKLGNSF